MKQLLNHYQYKPITILDSNQISKTVTLDFDKRNVVFQTSKSRFMTDTGELSNNYMA